LGSVSALLVMSLGLSAFAQGQGNPNPGVLPANSKPHGMSYGEWSDAWWQWAVSIPAAENPLLDATGANAGVGQSGPVWFLAGTARGGVAERSVTVPPGTALFFPIYNGIWINTPQFGDDPWSAKQEAFARAAVAKAVDDVTFMYCIIDGRAVQDLAAYRCETPKGGAFEVDLPADNLFNVPADRYGPSVTGGFYLMLAPLSAGPHTIHIHSEKAASGFYLDVKYQITVRREN
jgi:hypothetical protein